MRCTVVVEFDGEPGESPRRVELLRLHRDEISPSPGDIGLTLAEAQTAMSALQQEFVAEQIGRFCRCRRKCGRCNTTRRLHDSRCSRVATVLGPAYYVRERWKACACGADGTRYLSPLKSYVSDTFTPELKWLHAKLGAMLPYRQALDVLTLLLPSSGRDNHVSLRNHTVAVGQATRLASPPHRDGAQQAPIAEMGVDVGYVRKAKRADDSKTESGSISILVAAVGPKGALPRVWASAQPRTGTLPAEMAKFLGDSGFGKALHVTVISDAAADLAALADKLPQNGTWMLDWAHIGRKLWQVDRLISPLAHGRLTLEGSAFELWDLFVRFRSYVWTGQTDKWQASGQRLYELLELRERTDKSGLAQRARQTRYRLSDALQYLETNIHSLIDYRRYKQEGRRISTGFVESTINRVVGRRMCKGQQMRWSRSGADGVVQVRVAVQNREFDDVARQNFSWSGSQRVSWPWMQPSRPF